MVSIVIRNNIFQKIFLGIISIFFSTNIGYCANDSAQADFMFELPSFTRIAPITSPVLTAHITDRTGNLYSPLMSRFRVITNATEAQTLYLKANVVTDGGYEEAMFEQGGQVYVAFANLARVPKSNSLANCKAGGMPDDSPGIVAYPVTSIVGAQHKYLSGKNKYELSVNTGVTDITVNIGSNVLKSSFGGNDPRGFYQAILSLTDADI